MKVGMMDAIQSIINAATACLLESKGDEINPLLLAKLYEKRLLGSEVLSPKKMMIRITPNIISMIAIKPSTYGTDLYP